MRKMHRAQTASRQQDLAPGGLGRIAVILFLGSCGALVIIFRGSGEQAHSSGDLVNTAIK